MTDRVVCIANLRNKSVIYLFTCTSIEQFYVCFEENMQQWPDCDHMKTHNQNVFGLKFRVVLGL